MNKKYLVTVDDDLEAAINRARGEVPAVEWIRNRLKEIVSGQAAPPVRQVSAPRVTAPVSRPVEQPAIAPPVNDKRAAALSAISGIPRRMVASQKPADEPGDVTYDTADAQG